MVFAPFRLLTRRASLHGPSDARSPCSVVCVTKYCPRGDCLR